MSDQNNPYYQAYLREKRARVEVESLLEDSTRQLYEKNLQLQQQIDQIQQQQQSLIQQEKLATLGTMAAGVAHEINNPLAYIISNLETLTSYCQTLLTAADPEQQVSVTELAYVKDDLMPLIGDTTEGLARITEITKKLLFFARTDVVGSSELDLAEAVDFALKLLKPKLVGVHVSTAFVAAPLLYFNGSELNQVLVNILVNAIQACEEIPNRSPTLQISTELTERQLLLHVQDNGIGMSAETQAKMFDAFYTTKAVGTGTGVGLAIVLQILQQHHCTIQVKSVLQQGTTISIGFPLPADVV